jgi:purine-binding chemotaxis protein CheW
MKTEQQILFDRAKLVAGRKADLTASQGDVISVVEFLLTPERYAIAGSFVREVLPLKEIASIPGTQAFVMGVISLRGKIISIINLKILFGLKERGLTEMNKVIILENGAMRFGIVTDAIIGNKLVPLNSVSAPPLNLSSTAGAFVNGVTADGLILLDGGILLSSPIIISESNKKSKINQ